MKELLPLSTDTDLSLPEERDPKLVGIDDEYANTVFSALSSETARRILKLIYQNPRTPSEVASAVDTSLQNVNYHLNKLCESGFVEVVGSRYSEQGREMDVYAPSHGPLVIHAGADASKQSLSTGLKGLLGAVGTFGLSGLLVNRLIRISTRFTGGNSDTSGLITTDSPSGDVVVVGDGPLALVYQIVHILTTPGGIIFSIGVFLSVLFFIIWYFRSYQARILLTE